MSLFHLQEAASPSQEGLIQMIKNGIIQRWFHRDQPMTVPVSQGIFTALVNFEPVKDEGNYVIIRNFPVGWFRRLIKRQYGSHKLANMFEKVGFTHWAYSATVKVHKFFLPELVYILGQGSGGRANQTLIDRIIATTWLKDLYQEQDPPNGANLSLIDRDMNVQLFDWQKEFIETYDIKRQRAHLNGELLSFGCGLGKTITSLALMKALDCDAVVVIAPKSTLEDVWVDHLNRFFKRRPKYYLVNKMLPCDAEYFIFNYESMDKLDGVMEYLKSKRRLGIIVDESHNFLKMKSLRTQNLIKLREVTRCEHVLLQSGTPLKSLGSECIPLLRVVDPLFDQEAEEIFRKAFGLNTTFGTDILHARMELIMHRRKMEEVFQLPEKKEWTIDIKIENGTTYTITNVKKLLTHYAMDRIKYHKERWPIYVEEWNECWKWFTSNRSISSTADWARYEGIIKRLRKSGYNNFDKAFTKEVAWANEYEKNVLDPALPKDLRVKFRDCKSAVKYLDMKVQGEVLGYLDNIRAQMTTEMLKGVNLEDIITSSLKKVLFFTTYVSTVETLDSMLKQKGYKTILLYGKTSKNAVQLLNQFRTDKDVKIMIATMQTLATGVTLTEANTAVFLNDPWRNADKEQASNRIWRIGQDTPCDVITLHLDTAGVANLSDRTADILDWSKQMASMITDGIVRLFVLYRSLVGSVENC